MPTNRPSRDLSSKILIAFSASLAVCIGTPALLGIGAAPLLQLTGVPFGSLAVIAFTWMLPYILIASVCIGTIASIILWILHDDTSTEQSELTLAQMVRAGIDNEPYSPPRQAFVPIAGTLLVLTGIGAAIFYFWRPPIAYRYWQFFQILPWLICIVVAVGTILTTSRDPRRCDRLPKVSHRLSTLLNLVAAIIALASVMVFFVQLRVVP